MWLLEVYGFLSDPVHICSNRHNITALDEGFIGTESAFYTVRGSLGRYRNKGEGGGGGRRGGRGIHQHRRQYRAISKTNHERNFLDNHLARAVVRVICSRCCCDCVV